VYVNDALVTSPVTINCTQYPGCPIKFHPLLADDYTVLLEVRTKRDEVLDALGDGYNYDNATTTKTAILKALIFIDCFTAKARRCGYTAATVGRDETPYDFPADAYTFDELVTLYSWVVYKNNPMQGRLVSFEVYSPLGLFLVEQNMTDANGVAFIKFRIPTPCGDPAMYEGKWYCFQKVLLCDEYYNDTVMWDVGYIVEITSVDVPTIVDMTQPFDVTIYAKNIAMASRDVLIAVKVLDDNLVPVIFLNFTTVIAGGDWCKPNYESRTVRLMLPKWTYPGTGRVIVDAWFHGLPTQCGHCCCPPVQKTFAITCPLPTPPDP